MPVWRTLFLLGYAAMLWGLLGLSAPAYAVSDPLRPLPPEVQALRNNLQGSIEQQTERARVLASGAQGALAVHATILLGKLQSREETIEQALQSMASAVSQARRLENPELLLTALEAQVALAIERIQFASAHAVLDEMAMLAARRGLPLWEARTYALRGALRRREGDYAQALQFHERALELRERLDDRYGQVESLNAIATLRRRGGELYQALDGHTKALRIARELGNPSDMAESTNRISRIYAELDDIEPAREFMLQALAAVPENAHTQRAEFLIDLAALQLRVGEVAAAQTSTDQAIALARRVGADSVTAAGYLRRARIVDAQGQSAQALVWIDRSISMGRKFDGARSVASKRLTRLQLLLSLERWPEAVREAQPLLDQVRSMGDRLLERDVLQMQSRALFGAGDPQGAYLAMSAYSTLNQSLATTLTSRRIADLESNMKRRALEADLALLARERDLQTLRGERQQWTVIVMAALGLALLGGLFALRTRVRAASTMNRMLLRQAEQLRNVAQTDALTGLTNRHGAQPVLDALSGSAGACMILLDLDHFKRVNDQYGHPAGDTVLHTVAVRLRSASPPGWTLARWGGEEFLLLGRVVQPEQAVAYAETMRQAVAQSPIRIDETLQLSITASIGVSVQTTSTPAIWEEQLRVADQALYRVKSSGRDRVEMSVLSER